MFTSCHSKANQSKQKRASIENNYREQLSTTLIAVSQFVVNLKHSSRFYSAVFHKFQSGLTSHAVCFQLIDFYLSDKQKMSPDCLSSFEGCH